MVNQNLCDHILIDEMGGMGDAYTCVKCGFSKYPESFPFLWLYKLRGRVIKRKKSIYSISIKKKEKSG